MGEGTCWDVDEVSVHKIGIQRLLLMVGSTEIIGDL